MRLIPELQRRLEQERVAQQAQERAAKGETVLLVRTETSPEDIGGMVAATTLALFFVTLFYYLITSITSRLSGVRPAVAGRDDSTAASGGDREDT